MMRWLLFFALSIFALNAAAERYTVPAHFWFEPRSGESVAADPVLAQAVKLFLQKPHAALIIHHARDDESQARAEELRGWLIALGLEASRLSLAENRATASAADRLLTIEIVDNK